MDILIEFIFLFSYLYLYQRYSITVKETDYSLKKWFKFSCWEEDPSEIL